MQLDRVRGRLAERRIALEVTDAAVKRLAALGYDPTFGARPLKRTIQQQVADPLAIALLEGRYGEGDTVTVDVDADEAIALR